MIHPKKRLDHPRDHVHEAIKPYYDFILSLGCGTHFVCILQLLLHIFSLIYFYFFSEIAQYCILSVWQHCWRIRGRVWIHLTGFVNKQNHRGIPCLCSVGATMLTTIPNWSAVWTHESQGTVWCSVWLSVSQETYMIIKIHSVCPALHNSSFSCEILRHARAAWW